VFVASVSSAARTALAVKKGWELTDVLPKLRQLLRAHGVHFVLDAQIGSNLALLEVSVNKSINQSRERKIIVRFK
jgi:hypothetical protein